MTQVPEKRNNPGGFKKGYDKRRYVPKPLRSRKSVRELAKKKGKGAIKVLSEIMYDKDESAANRIKAAEVLLNRGFGTAATMVQLEMNDKRGTDSPESLPIQQLRSLVAEYLGATAIPGEAEVISRESPSTEH